jgi:RHS repeat-associated protein
MVELNSSGTYTETVYGLGSEKLALMSGQNMQKLFIALPSGTAVYTASGLSYYRHSDWLGSARFASTTSRSMYSSSAYAPFGEQYATAGTSDQNFTGQQPDSTSGLYDFLFRRLSQTQGRWISPDPAGLAAVSLTNPQSWNRYAYITSNPLSAMGLFGLDASSCAAEFDSCSGGIGRLGGGGGSDGGGGGGALPDWWDQTTWDGDMISHGFEPAAQEAMRAGLYNYLWGIATGGYLPSECHFSPYDGQWWCGSGDADYGDWTPVGQVEIQVPGRMPLPKGTPPIFRPEETVPANVIAKDLTSDCTGKVETAYAVVVSTTPSVTQLQTDRPTVAGPSTLSPGQAYQGRLGFARNQWYVNIIPTGPGTLTWVFSGSYRPSGGGPMKSFQDLKGNQHIRCRLSTF